MLGLSEANGGKGALALARPKNIILKYCLTIFLRIFLPRIVWGGSQGARCEVKWTRGTLDHQRDSELLILPPELGCCYKMSKSGTTTMQNVRYNNLITEQIIICASNFFSEKMKV